jgi:hypothetical protein
MRFNQIKEASIISRPGAYSYGHKVNISGSKQGQELLNLIKNEISDFDPKETLTWIEKSNGPQIRVGLGTAASMSFQRPNGESFTLVGPVQKIESGLNHAAGAKGSTAENKGDLAEPLLSAAVVAKLIKRGTNNVGDISIEDLKNTLTQAMEAGNQTYKVEDRNSKVADTIEFRVAIRGPAMEFMRSENFWPTVANIAQSAVHYANSGQIDRYADYFYKNGKADLIKVDSDGLSDQKGRKTDIDAFVKGEDGQMRSLKNLAISLKAGSDTIGQVGGGRIDNPFYEPKDEKGGSGIYVAANRLFGPLGITIEKPTGPVKDRTQFWVDAYKQAEKQLKDMLKGEDAKKEAGVVMKIGDFVAQQGSSGNPNVKLVSLKSTGQSSVHTFKDLAQKLSRDNIDLDAQLKMGTGASGSRPTLYIYDKNSGEMALKIRYSVANAGTAKEKVWNPVEMGTLIQRLTSVKYKSKEKTPPTLSQAFIIQLKGLYGNLQQLTPAQQKQLNNEVNRLTPSQLKQLADANIKWASDAARRELQRRNIA